MSAIQTVQLEHGSLSFRKWGFGRPFLMITGSPFGSFEFRDVGETLSMSSLAVAPDLPGFGGSDPVDDMSPAGLCEVVLSFFAAAGLDTMVFTASGISCLIALELLDKHPEYLAGVMLLNPVLSEEEARRKPPYITRSSTTSIDILGFAQRRALAELKKLLRNPEALDEQALEAARAGLERHRRKKAAALFENVDPGRFPAYFEAMRRFTKPLHVLWGDYDPLWVPGALKRFKEQVPDTRMHIIPQAGHFMALETPSELADALLELGREAW